MKKKVRVIANWDSSENLVKRLLDQYKTSDDVVSNIEWVYDDSYEILVVFNHINIHVKEDVEKILMFSHEPFWSGNHVKYMHYIPNLYYFTYNKTLYAGGVENNVIESPSFMFYGGRGPWAEHDDWMYEKLPLYDSFEKTKTISSVISWNSEKKADTCLYPERSALVKYLIDNKVDFIDIYGGWGDEGHLKGYSMRKLDSLKEYKFSLAIENEYMPNYFTEKLTDCIITNTIPIYFGCANMKEIWGEDGYIEIEDINDHERILKMLQEINKDADRIYYSLLPALKKMREHLFNNVNLLKKINELI